MDKESRIKYFENLKKISEPISHMPIWYENERPNNGGEFFKDVVASSTNNEHFLDIEKLPKGINYSF